VFNEFRMRLESLRRPSLPSPFSRKRRMNRRRMVAVPRAWDTLELMSLEYVTRDFGGAFFPSSPLPPSLPPSVRSFAGGVAFYFSAFSRASALESNCYRVAFSIVCVSHKNRCPAKCKVHENMIFVSNVSEASSLRVTRKSRWNLAIRSAKREIVGLAGCPFRGLACASKMRCIVRLNCVLRAAAS